MPPALHTVLGAARLRHIPGGQILLYEGDMPPEVYIIKSGVVKIYDIDDAGNEKVLHLVKQPAVVPFAFFSGMRDPLRWFYTALTDCDVYVLLASDLLAATLADGMLAQTLTNAFSDDVHELLTRLSSLGKTNVRDKLIAALQFLVTCHAVRRHSGWWRVTFPVNHQLLADLCGITRESTATVMKELQTEHVVRNPRLAILEIDAGKLSSA